MSTHKICFSSKVTKIILNYRHQPHLSGSMEEIYLHVNGNYIGSDKLDS